MNNINSLKSLREEAGLTQVKAASLIGMPLRTYKDYENLKEREGTLKYQQALSILEDHLAINEEKGLLSKERITSIVSEVLSTTEVTKCYLFGSYAQGRAKETSDVDLLVFNAPSDVKFFELIESLREHLHKRVDLLRGEVMVNDPKFILEILKTGVKIYDN